MDSDSRRFAAGINWYPGHMKKTREMIQENLKLVDAVVEVIDANGEKTTYVKMTADKVAKVVTDHLVNGNVVSEYTIGNLK